jgi:three-Cys-motif partner protein
MTKNENLDENLLLFDLTDYHIITRKLKLKQLEAPVWTENKARLIYRYLRYFVFITKHGTYIDVFAGPQAPEHPDSWAARMVLNSEPRWLRNFAFFEKETQKISHLEKLLEEQPKKPKRKVKLYQGDMNILLPVYLQGNPVSDASFCLIDQHTFECNWSTILEISRHKNTGHKIEIFYFLAQGWLDRAIAGLKKPDETLGIWWGNDGWKNLQKKPSVERGQMLAERFKIELGYQYAAPYPIYEKVGSESGKIMFWMVHASDHPEALKLMVRAYNKAVAPLEPMEQLKIEFQNVC